MDLQDWCDTKLEPALAKMDRRRAPELPPVLVSVRAPGCSYDHGDPDQLFHTASIGKVFTAVLVARLAGQGVVDLDHPIGDLVPAADLPVDLGTLPAEPGVDLARDLTLDHLLSHRSGLPDPMEPPKGHRTACDLQHLTGDPDRLWTPADVLAETVTLPATGRPGETFAYGDASYALVLVVLEAVTGTPFTQLLREQVFEPAGMRHTSQPHSDPSVSDAELAALDIAPMLVADRDLSRVRALSAGSADGGAVTTTGDLLRLLQALRGGDLVPAELMARLETPRSRLRPGIHYGTGLTTLRFDGFMPLVLRGLPQPVGGLGITGNHAFSYPEQHAHVVMAFHSTRAMSQSIQTHTQIARQLARL